MNRLLAHARFRHIQVLVQLAEVGSVRGAAVAVGMSQPGVTRILSDLERLLDVTLFQRHARGVRPTLACNDVLPFARQILVGLGAGAEAVAFRRGLGDGVVRLIASTAAVNGLLVRALPEFNLHSPSVQLQLKEAEIDDALLAIARGEVDLVVCREPAVAPEGWGFRPLLADNLVVACSVGHPLARRHLLDWPDLVAETWLPGPTGSAARIEFDARMGSLSSELRICQVITRVPAATWALLAHQQLLTLVPFSVVRHLVDAGALAVLRMKEVMPVKPIGTLFLNTDANSATVRLAAYLHCFTAARGVPQERKKNAVV